MDHINQRGVIPLFFLIPVVVVAVGVVGIQSGFFKFLAPPSPSTLPQYLSQFQQEPVRLPTPLPTLKMEGEIQDKPFIYQEEKVGVKRGVPSFTINAPRGWVKTGNGLARFESTEVDVDKVDEGSVTTNAIINIKATGSYQSLEDFVDQYKASGSKVRGYQLLDSATTGNGYRLELRYVTPVGEKDVTIHELAYLFYKDGVSFLVRGYSTETAWSKHLNEIKPSLNSFKFN